MIPLHDRNPTGRTPWITIALILVNIGVFVLLQGGGTASDQEQLQFTYEHAAIPCEIVRQRPLTIREINADACPDVAPRGRVAFPDKHIDLAIFVSMFLHASWIHLLGNMLFLWIFGNNVEDRLGPVWYLGFYLLGGVVATAAQLSTDPTSTAPLLGASGAIAAVMGAYLLWFPRARILTWLAFLLIIVVEVPAWIVLGFWFVSQFFTQANSGVAWMAHVGGFVYGIAIAALLRPRHAREPELRYF